MCTVASQAVPSPSSTHSGGLTSLQSTFSILCFVCLQRGGKEKGRESKRKLSSSVMKVGRPSVTTRGEMWKWIGHKAVTLSIWLSSVVHHVCTDRQRSAPQTCCPAPSSCIWNPVALLDGRKPVMVCNTATAPGH